MPYWTSKFEHIVSFTAIFSNICTAHAQKRYFMNFRCKFRHRRSIHRPRFPVTVQNFGDLATFSVDFCRMLNKYGERSQPCRTPFLTRNHSDSVPATVTLASCFLYSLASKLIKCRGYPMSIIVTHSLSWEIESNAFLKSTKHI